MTNTDIIARLNRCYATKAFDPDKKIPEKDFEILLEALRLSPSAYGLQPWKFVVVRNPGLRHKLMPYINNKGHVTDSSHLIVLCGIKEITPGHIDKYIEYAAKERGQQPADFGVLRARLSEFLSGKPESEIKGWIDKQVYIALGVLLSVCAETGIDACPVEGFNHEGFDEILGLERFGVTARVLCPVGYRLTEKDFLVNLKKVRFPKEEVIIEL